MKPTASAILVAAGIILVATSCSGGRPSRERDGGIAIAGIDGRIAIIRPGPDANAAYSEALDLKTGGNCPAAVIKLRSVAGLGPGYENAQTALGSCLLETDPTDKELSSDYLEGLTWLRRAGDAGWPEAQSALAVAHAFGPSIIRNGGEAAYWLALYEANAGKSRIGFVPMNAADVAAVGKALTAAEKQGGAERAALWQRKIWLPPAQPPASPEPGRGPRGGQQRGQRDPL